MTGLMRLIVVAAAVVAAAVAAPVSGASSDDLVLDRAIVFKNDTNFSCYATVAGQQVFLYDFILLGTPTGDVISNCHGQVPSELTEGTSAVKVICTLQLPNGDTAETIGVRVITQSGEITLSCRWPGALIGVF